MGMRMDKYKSENEVPTRSDKNQELYKQIYNAYDEFENLIVPSNAREITMSELKKEITSREEYRERKAYDAIANKQDDDKMVIRSKERIQSEPQVYDIKELLNKAVSNQNDVKENIDTLSNGDYLKKIKVDSRKTNIEQVKENYDELLDEELDEDESLLKTANLSLEILSDLKSDNDKTIVEAPIKESELPEDIKDTDFYSSKYKFSKKDFEDRDDDSLEDDSTLDSGDRGLKKFIKVLLLVFGILLILILLLYIFKFFNRV